MVKVYFKIASEAVYNTFIAPVCGWIAYHSVLFAAWMVDISIEDVEIVAKIIGAITGLIVSTVVYRHVKAQIKNVNEDTIKKKAETEKINLEARLLRQEVETEEERSRIERELALKAYKDAINGNDSEIKN